MSPTLINPTSSDIGLSSNNVLQGEGATDSTTPLKCLLSSIIGFQYSSSK